MSFLVRWLGYEEEDDSWVDWSEIRDTEQLHIYLASKGLGALFPQKFKRTGDNVDSIAVLEDNV